MHALFLQDSLFFLRTFFTEISGGSTKEESPAASSSKARRDSVTRGTTPPPVMTVGGQNVTPDTQEVMIMFDEIEEDTLEYQDEDEEESGESTKSQPVFFK